MKTKLRLILIFFLFYQIHSRAQTYVFSHSIATYADLSSPQIVTSPNWDDFNLYSTIIPFQFQLFGAPFDTIYFYSDQVSFRYDFSQYGIGCYMYCGLVDNSSNTANISYQTTGVTPYRIFKLQLKNAAFYDNTSGTDYTNYQLWLYESTNVVEIHYGPNSILDPQSWNVPGATGPGVAIGVDANNILTLNGAASNPTLFSSTSTLVINGAPADGMVYIFTPSVTSVNEIDENKTFQIVPNPNNGTFGIEIKNNTSEIEFSVFDLEGKRVYHSDSFQNGSKINLSLSTGLYFAEIRDSNRLLRKKFVIE